MIMWFAAKYEQEEWSATGPKKYTIKACMSMWVKLCAIWRLVVSLTFQPIYLGEP